MEREVRKRGARSRRVPRRWCGSAGGGRRATGGGLCAWGRLQEGELLHKAPVPLAQQLLTRLQRRTPMCADRYSFALRTLLLRLSCARDMQHPHKNCARTLNMR